MSGGVVSGRESIAEVLYVIDHGDWISGTPGKPWGTSREQSRRAEYERKADALLASPALADLLATERQRGRAEALREAADGWDRVHEDPEAIAYIQREYHAGGPSAPSIWLRRRAALASQDSA